ncbi:MAG: lipooligosaccharide sialyltransferase [Lachnospiraceae bacterium]|nr:lipooligosaccharide sialyltransferase [Lachnospiraceae bacterium]
MSKDLNVRNNVTKSRIYVCHTYYHVYVTMLKEFALPKEEQGTATLVLSKMSTDFEDLQSRLLKLGVFEEILLFDEKPYTFFEELAKYKVDYGNFVKNMVNRIIFTKKFARLQSAYVPVDFSQYREVYVFCDSDPIGYYLNYKRIPYHSVEDGLNSLVHVDAARYDNRGNFPIKAFLAKLNLIFIQNGYSKYCVDMEVNQIEGIRYPIKKHKEVPRRELEARLTEEEKKLIIQGFVADASRLRGLIERIDDEKKNIVILTEPLCELPVRKQIFSDLIEEYKKQGTVVLKPHPRDVLDYEKEFPEHLVFDKRMPMEILNLLGQEFFDLAVAVLTDINGIRFAGNAVRLGPDFMDKYEAPEIHRQNEQF